MRVSRIEPGRSAALASALLVVQRAAYRLEAALIGDDRIPPLHETVQELQLADVEWMGAFRDDGTLIGAVAWTAEPGGLDIDRLVVSPAEHRRGVGTALVDAILVQADGLRTSVSTGRANTPALHLYRRLGFVAHDDVEVVPGLWITRLLHPGTTPAPPRRPRIHRTPRPAAPPNHQHPGEG